MRADGGKPTSRGLPPAAPLGDAALPCGQGALPVCGGRRCLPCGQRRCRVARRIMAYRGRKRGLKAFCPSGNFPGAPGNGARCPPRAGLPGRNFPACRGTRTSRVSPPGTEIRALSQTERALLPATPSTVSDAALCKHASPPSLFAANIRRMRPTPASFARKLPTFRPSRRRLIPKPSRGETGGLCPHPLKGPDP